MNKTILFFLFSVLYYTIKAEKESELNEHQYEKRENYENIGAYKSVPDPSNLKYRTGNCLGYIGGGYWDDANNSYLAAMAGLDGQRKKLPEDFLVRWGYNIETWDCKANNELGIYDFIAYLAKPDDPHSTNPNNAENSPPKNLYEKIWNEDGTVNENNYWAYYVYNVVQNYKPYVLIYEVWNEPDYTRSYNQIDSWYNEPPDPTILSHWNGDIFSYIRILRVTYEVVKKYHPEAYVATGGLGYDSFLDAILRYTDNPNGGTITSEYPAQGGAYFDCQSFHKYPRYGTTDVQTGKVYNKYASDSYSMNMMTMKKNHEYLIKKYGFDGKKYPEKIYICSESGVDSTGEFGSDLIRRNFNLKTPIYALEYNITQIHYFVTADGNSEGNADYLPGIGSKTKENAMDLMKPSTKARLVLKKFNLSKMKVDVEKTRKWRDQLGSGLTGTVLIPKFPQENETEWHDIVYSAWVECFDEETEATVQKELTFDFYAEQIDYKQEVKYIGKKKNVILSSTPLFFVESFDTSAIENDEKNSEKDDAISFIFGLKLHHLALQTLIISLIISIILFI
ncbi:hypothetical protein BCR32DRAFT_265004 [Anaeromyces robustus]|uniref:Glycoside hydrolase n=1 Tax=Anaeromyces robustus TaxID=1754192 RepID=A0A1Y1XMA1_9FUNG|nr:hypothetical protein BCR32DRAFT_265004 [Anaeromyces robustus]|eukprot:ORX86474.1 hypothetical protein BCR32DRAFT_265004 [Anaeromyces robustus]